MTVPAHWNAEVRRWIIDPAGGSSGLTRAIQTLSWDNSSARSRQVAAFLKLAAADPSSFEPASVVGELAWLPPEDFLVLRLVAFRPIALIPGTDLRETAAKAAELCVVTSAELNDDQLRAFFLEQAAYRRQELGNLRLATRYLAASARLHRLRNHPATARGRVSSNLAGLWLAQGRIRLARRTIEEAVKAFREAVLEPGGQNARPFLARALLNLTRQRRILGELDQAAEHSAEVLLLYRLDRVSPIDQAEALNERGLIELELGRMEAAHQTLLEALELLRDKSRLLDSSGEAVRVGVETNLALAKIRLGDWVGARRILEPALRHSPSSGRLPILALLAVVDVQDGNPKEAQARLIEVLKVTGTSPRILATPTRWVAAGAMHNLSVLARLAGDLVEARRWGEGARDLFETALPDALLAERVACWVNLALLELDTSAAGGLPAARQALQSARSLAERYAGRVHDPIGRRRARVSTALAYELSAVVAAEAWEFSGDSRALEEAFEAAEAGRGRRLADLLDDAAVGSRRTSGPAREPWSASSVAALLPRDVPTAIVVFSLARGVGKALIATEGIREVVNLPGAADGRLVRLVKAWSRGHQRARSIDPAESPHAHASRILPRLLEELASQVVRPVAKRLASRGIQRVILIPSRYLNLVPLAACPMTSGGGPLAPTFADQFEVVTIPSLSILAHSLRPPSASKGIGLSLIVGRSLLYARVEARLVAARLAGVVEARGDGRDRIGPSARLIDTRAQVIHYCGHAFFDPYRPLRSALDPSGLPSDRLTLAAIFRRVRLPATELVVLSGCETGLVRADVLDSGIGLATGLLLAGARCVVASLWAVDDLSSALLMGRFHREWSGGCSPAIALRQAQGWLRRLANGQAFREAALAEEFLSALQDSAARDRWQEAVERIAADHPDTPPFASPFYWAPFVVSGIGGPPGLPLTTPTER